MKLKITFVLMLIMLPVLQFMRSDVFAQTVSGGTSNTGCASSGIVSASSTGLGTDPQYQLLKSGIVVRPVANDASQFTDSNSFVGLDSGIYTLKARSASGNTIYISNNINVSDGYTEMLVSSPIKAATCANGNAILTGKVTAGGKAPFIYTIAKQLAPNVILQSSGVINNATFDFNGLPVGNYIVAVTDACGQTIIASTSISGPAIGLNDLKLGSTAYPLYETAMKCSTPVYLYNELGFQYTSNNTTVSAADAANFTWKIKYQGDLYGQGTTYGPSIIGGPGFPLSSISVKMPAIATRDGVEADINNMKIVVIDGCGNSKEFPVILYLSSMYPSTCGASGAIQSTSTMLACFPVTVTYTNIANPIDVIVATKTLLVDVVSGFTPGATYHVTYIDAAGYTTGNFVNLPASQNITIPATSVVNVSQSSFGIQQNLEVLGFGRLALSVTPYKAGDIINYTVTASDNPLVPIGYQGTVTMGNYDTVILPNITGVGPSDYWWPKGNYTLDVTTQCGVATANCKVLGYEANVSGNNVTSVCGGFNYVMNGTFDTTTAYEVIIVSGPSGVGQVRDLANTKASLPFNGLSYGSYIFGLRIKGGTTNVFTQNVTYDANNVINVDKSSTGGYVCSLGGTDGFLKITATTDSPAPGNVLKYALSKDGGKTYGDFQSENLFTGLSNGTYYFQVEDGCGNMITHTAQIGVVSSPIATANTSTSPVICKSNTGTIELDVDIMGASTYLWAGPGINAANSALKNPLINNSDLLTGSNNYTCTITLGAPCNTTSVANLVITVNPLPVLKITDPKVVCSPSTVDITSLNITAGSDDGLAYTYFRDPLGSISLDDPNAIAISDTYYIKGNNGSCEAIAPINVIINTVPIETIAYPEGIHCNRGTLAVKLVGTTGGTYSGDPDLSINATSGLINLAESIPGTHTVTYISGTCSATVDVVIQATTMPLPLEDIAGDCSVILTAPSIVDSCAGNLIATTETVFPITNKGLSVVIWTYDYGNGYTQSVNQNVIIKDTTPPVAPVALEDLKGECSVTLVAPTAVDNCDGIITGKVAKIFPPTNNGVITVVWRFEDSAGNFSTTSQNIIIKDTQAPIAPVLNDVTEECNAILVIPTALDICDGEIIGKTETIFPITAKGLTVVTWRFEDSSGNYSTSDQNVYIKDTQEPVAPVLNDVTEECSAILIAPTALDNCDLDPIIGKTLTIFPITAKGLTVVTWRFEDSSGNYSISEQNVYIKDTQEPVAPVLNDVTEECSAILIAPTALDNCDLDPITGKTTTIFPITAKGLTVVTWRFEDSSGNYSTSEQNVFIKDTQAPVAPILNDVTEECSATLIAPTALDNCDLDPITGKTTTIFPITAKGLTVVTWRFEDSSGNYSTSEQNVFIKDTQAPVVPILNDVTGECSVVLEAPTTTDTCAGTVMGKTTTVFPITAKGITLVTWTFTDNEGNSVNAVQRVIIDTDKCKITAIKTIVGNPKTVASGDVLTYNITLRNDTAIIKTGINVSDIVVAALMNITAIDNAGVLTGNTIVWSDLSVSANSILVLSFNATVANNLPTGTTSIRNIAVVSDPIDTDNPVTPQVDVPLELNSSIAIIKKGKFVDENNDGYAQVGETINYTFQIKNTGNTSLTNVNVIDDLPGLILFGTPVDLEVGEINTTQFSGSYTITQSDIDAGLVTNQAIAEGTAPSGKKVDDLSDYESFTQHNPTVTNLVSERCAVKIYNGISSNNDGINDQFHIKGLECYSNNTVEIYNRWGVKVFETSNYGSNGNVFKGFSDGRATISKNDKLPTGTYFYILQYDDMGKRIQTSGYLYITNR